MQKIPEGFITPKEASYWLKVCEQTLRNWSKQGKLEFTQPKEKGGYRRYNVRKYLQDKCGVKFEEKEGKNRKNFIYCRVSTFAQKERLKEQVEFLRKRYPTYKIIKDFSSNTNFKRQGFLSLLERIKERDIGEVVVTNEERLCRDGFNLLEFLVRNAGGKITICSEEE